MLCKRVVGQLNTAAGPQGETASFLRQATIAAALLPLAHFAPLLSLNAPFDASLFLFTKTHLQIIKNEEVDVRMSDSSAIKRTGG
jgi:hypothetical protein